MQSSRINAHRSPLIWLIHVHIPCITCCNSSDNRSKQQIIRRLHRNVHFSLFCYLYFIQISCLHGIVKNKKNISACVLLVLVWLQFAYSPPSLFFIRRTVVHRREWYSVFIITEQTDGDKLLLKLCLVHFTLKYPFHLTEQTCSGVRSCSFWWVRGSSATVLIYLINTAKNNCPSLTACV